MRYAPFYSNFSALRKAKDKEMVRDILLSEVAEAIVFKRGEVIDALNNSGITTDSAITTEKLIEAVMENLTNKRFVGRLSLIIGKKDKEDFKSFMSMSGGKAKPKEYVFDICYAVSGNLNGSDKEALTEKVKDMTVNKGPKNTLVNGWAIFGILAVSATAIYLIGIQKVLPPKT